MMLAPRSYMYRAPSPERTDSEKRRSSIRSSSPKSIAPSRPRSTPLPDVSPAKKLDISRREEKPAITPPAAAVPARTVSEPVQIPTVPMLVQPRYHASDRSPSEKRLPQTVKSRGQHGGRTARTMSEKHDPNALPPAVAALLAVTAIPPPSRINRRRPTSQQRRISIDQLIQEWRQEGGAGSPPGMKSPLDVLLEPADETDTEEDNLLAGMEDERDAALLSSRSVSSDSISSTTPSLDAGRSTVSNMSAPTPPSYRNKRNISLRTEKVVSSPPVESCLEDHPLSSPSPVDIDTAATQTFPSRPKRVIKPESTFKSNLTASLKALKSAAKSFSNFTAPSIPQDDMLTRSLFTQPYVPEMRPRDIDGVPDPALRRYLNPPTQGVPHAPIASLDDFSFALQEALAQPPDDFADAPLIQMQTYSRRNKRGKHRQPSVGLDRGEASVLGQSLPALRQREPRENSDFLRVIVLEMNMRRTGKLDAKGPLRARIWLPPRKGGSSERGGEVEVRGSREVPMRWVGLSPEDL